MVAAWDPSPLLRPPGPGWPSWDSYSPDPARPSSTFLKFSKEFIFGREPWAEAGPPPSAPGPL